MTLVQVAKETNRIAKQPAWFAGRRCLSEKQWAKIGAWLKRRRGLKSKTVEEISKFSWKCKDRFPVACARDRREEVIQEALDYFGIEYRDKPGIPG